MANYKTVRFSGLPNSLPPLEFPGPPGGEPQRRRLLRMFVTGTTANHTVYSYQVTTVRRWRWNLTLPNLTAEQMTNLEDLWSLHLLGSARTFIWRHTNGKLYTARIMNEELEGTRTATDMHDVQLELEMLEQIDG
jgi:hypothetical protein